ncbi:MAG: pyridoxamine 5'-phosphate oxidase family protein [Actinomycetota bacterium]|nr:pyridoxamine 5'-phosphate oxidase family protein [Actinomycetota bacterium]
MTSTTTVPTTATHTTAATAPAAAHQPATAAHPTAEQVRKAIAKRSFCVIATASEANRPHVAGVLYAEVDGDLYISTMLDSRKAKNLLANPRVSVTVPIRRIPFGPPSNVQYATTAEVLDLDHPDVRRHAEAGRLKAITGHGELELDGGCFIRLAAPKVANTYGIGMSLLKLIRDPLSAGGRVELS